MFKLFLIVASVAGANPTQPVFVNTFGTMQLCEGAARNSKYMTVGSQEVSRHFICVPASTAGAEP